LAESKSEDITLLLDELNDFYKDISGVRRYGTIWLPPTCPVCRYTQTYKNSIFRVKALGPLSEKLASDRQVCLKCGSEFELKLVSPPKR